MLRFALITPEKTVAEGEAQSLSLPTRSGEIMILPHHATMNTLLAPGEMRIVEADGSVRLLAVSTGLIAVDNDVVTILADTADRSEDLQIDAIERAKAEADAALQNVRNADDVDYARLAARLERELARLKVARKHHGHRAPETES